MSVEGFLYAAMYQRGLAGLKLKFHVRPLLMSSSHPISSLGLTLLESFSVARTEAMTVVLRLSATMEPLSLGFGNSREQLGLSS